MSGMADKRASLTTEERRFADAVRSRLASAPEPKEDIARRAGLGRQTLYALKDAPAGVALRNVVSVARELGIDLVRDVLAAVSEPSAAEPPADLVTGVPLAAAGVCAGAGQLETLLRAARLMREATAVLDRQTATIRQLRLVVLLLSLVLLLRIVR